ncbi:MAG: hypothetical protein MI924_25240 [Chloroflexales bacterium]|nr:hypothetical protein [Chloroflexales bacterium]
MKRKPNIAKPTLVSAPSPVYLGSLLCVIVLLLTGCGASAESQIRATVVTAVEATIAAQRAAPSEPSLARLTPSATASTPPPGAASSPAIESGCEAAQLNAYADIVEQQINRFLDIVEIASLATPDTLDEPLQRLEQQQHKTERIDLPACLYEHHTAVLVVMALYLEGYRDKASQSDLAAGAATIEQAGELLAAVKGVLPQIRAGEAPDPIDLPGE